MATKEQYDVFKMLFDQEDKRYTNLIDRGKTFVSLATLYSGFITFTIEKLHNDTILSWALFSATVASMLLAFLLSVLAIGIYRYEMINVPENIIKAFGDEPPTNDDFFDDRIIDLAVACNRNSRRNDRRAQLLFWASMVMLLGLFLHGMYFLTRELPPIGGASAGRMPSWATTAISH